MKKIIFVLLLAINEMLSSIANAQGTLYFSNLELAPGAAIAFGSDAGKGQGFYTGTNTSVTTGAAPTTEGIDDGLYHFDAYYEFDITLEPE